jgi:hypothetical protein
MKDSYKILIGITSLAAAFGIVLYYTGKNKKHKNFERLEMIADEGYETAADILFPLREKTFRKYRTQFE